MAMKKAVKKVSEKGLLVTIILMLSVSLAEAADFYTLKSGRWTDPSTWNQGANLPTINDRAIVRSSHAVTVSAADTNCIAQQLLLGQNTNDFGYFIQDGGYLRISQYVRIGWNGANSTYDMSSGILQLDGGFDKRIGQWPEGNTASMTLSGDALLINNGGSADDKSFRIGDNNPSGSTLTLRDNAIMTNNCQLWIGQYFNTNADGTFNWHGTGTLNMEGGTLVMKYWSVLGRDNGEGIINHSLGTIQKTDGNDFVVGHNSNGVGTLDINGGAIMEIIGSYFKLGQSTNTSVMRVYGNASVLAGREFWVGDGERNPGGGHHRAVLDVSENGSISVSNHFAIGRNNAIGVVNMRGGSITKLNGGGYLIIGSSSQPRNQGMLHQEGGNVYDQSGWIMIGENGIGVWDMWGGYASASSVSVGENNVGFGVLTVGGTAELNATNVYMARNNNATGTLNIAGGVLAANQILRGAGTGPKIINFNGGTLKARVATTDFIQNMEGIYVYGGGMKVDSDDNNITIPRQLNAPVGNGITNISLLSGGWGHIAPPIVWITGGGGNGATAVAHIDAGAVTNIQIVSPGVGYTSTPDVFIEGGGGYDVQIDTIGLGPSASGGLTKLGLGTLTLTATNTITGDVVVNDGTLSIASPWISSSANVYIYSTGKLNLNFTGTNKVYKFFIDDIVQPSGVYNSGNCSSITGSGNLRAMAGKGEGFYMIIR